MSGMTVDGDGLKRARLTSGISRGEAARLAGISSRTLALIESNSMRTARDLTLDKLVRMAEAVSVDPFELLGQAPESTKRTAEVEQDVARLLAALAATNQSLRPVDIVAVFGWSTSRFDDAVSRANADLRSKSLVISEGSRGLRLQPASSRGHDDAASIIATVASTEGLDSFYMKVLLRFWSGKVNHANPGRRSHAAVALLTRLGLLEPVDGGTQFRTTYAVNFAFPDDLEDEGPAIP